MECSMLLQNPAFQNVSLTHRGCHATIEKILKLCGGLEDIGKKALQHPEVQDTWAKSTEPTCELFTQWLPSVLLKSKNFEGVKG